MSNLKNKKKKTGLDEGVFERTEGCDRCESSTYDSVIRRASHELGHR